MFLAFIIAFPLLAHASAGSLPGYFVWTWWYLLAAPASVPMLIFGWRRQKTLAILLAALLPSIPVAIGWLGVLNNTPG